MTYCFTVELCQHLHCQEIPDDEAIHDHQLDEVDPAHQESLLHSLIQGVRSLDGICKNIFT